MQEIKRKVYHVIVELPDGLYQVSNNVFTAGFAIKDQRVIDCAPILVKNFFYWAKKAKFISSL